MFNWIYTVLFPSLGNLLGIILNFAVLDTDVLHTLLIGNSVDMMFNNPFLDGEVITFTLHSYNQIVSYVASLDLDILAGVISLFSDFVSILGSAIYTIVFELPFNAPLCIGLLIGIVRAFILFTIVKWIITTFLRE